MFCASSIIQRDNGRESVNQLLDELVSTFPNMQFIRGCPTHPLSQGSMEAVNKIVEHKLHAVMLTANSADWYSAACNQRSGPWCHEDDTI